MAKFIHWQALPSDDNSVIRYVAEIDGVTVSRWLRDGEGKYTYSCVEHGSECQHIRKAKGDGGK
jgi:hypothetical protein